MTRAGTQIRAIRTEQDHHTAVERSEQLMESAPGSLQADELDVLATLVDAYEAKHFKIDAPDPIAVIEFRMDQMQLTRKDLEQIIGSRARASEVLTGRRSLTLGMIRRLRDQLGIPADLLIGSDGVGRGKRKPSATGSKKTSASSKKPDLTGNKPRQQKTQVHVRSITHA